MKQNKILQSGRSMVEMLGTLAIIGVLSIGGIAGYSYGMDKYRANETLRNISLRAVDLIAQANHAADLSFAEWENEDTVYDFSNPAYCDSDDNLIMFDIGATEKIPQNICQIIFDGLSNVAVQIDINESPAISKDSCGKNNTMTFYFAGGGNASVDNDTGEGAAEEKCGSTVCGTCQKCENETCVTVADYEQKCTTNDNKTGWCVRGTCEPDTTCNCGAGEYCTDTNDRCEKANPSGTCVEAKSKFKEEVIDGTTYYISRNTMSWWDGMSACKAMGKKMINHNEITQSCSASDTDCSSVNTKLNAIGKFLYEVVWSNGQYVYVWSNVVYDSCNAYDVHLSRGMVEESGYRTNYYQGFYTICK